MAALSLACERLATGNQTGPTKQRDHQHEPCWVLWRLVLGRVGLVADSCVMVLLFVFVWWPVPDG
jgi:hypothetical protein